MHSIVRLAVAYVLTILAACGPSNPAANKPQEVPLGQLPDTVEPTRYRLDLTIDPGKPRFAGIVEIDIALKKPAQELYLHGRELTVETVTARLADGTNAAASYRQVHDTGVAKLVFDRELPKGGATLRFVYDAAFESTPDALTSQVDNGEKYAWTQFQEISARRAFPGFDEPRFKTPFEIAITARKSHAAVSNAHAIRQEAVSADLAKTTFAPTKPLPTYLVALIVGPYDVEEGPTIPAFRTRQTPIVLRGVTVKGKGDRSRYALVETPPLLRYLEDYFATPYPYSKLDLIAPPNFSAGGMENAGAITYTERGILLDDSASIQQKRYFALLHAHEVAHMWFGDLVTAKWWDDIWLNEAFATWMGNKAATAVWPANEFSRETIRDALDVMDTDSLSTARAVRQPIKSADDIFNAFDGLTYRKGAGVLAMFESYLGEEAFREGVRTHMRRFAHGSANVRDFMESLAKGSGKPEVVPAFESFLNQPGVPLVRVKTTCSDRDLIVELAQSPFGAMTADDKRQWSVPVCMREVAKGRYRSCTMLTERTATLTAHGQCGATLMPNADGTGYYRFAIASADWQKLGLNAARLNPGEQLALLHSLRAAFRAGETDAATYMATLKTVGTGATWDTVQLAGTFLHELRSDLLAKGDLRRFEQSVRSWFAPALASTRLEPRRREPRATALLRAELADVMVRVARDPGTLTPLAAKGASLFRTMAQGSPPEPLAPELVQAALWSAIYSGGAPVARDAIAAIRSSTDAQFRVIALTALAAARDSIANQEIEEFVVSGALSVREQSAYLRNAFADAERRPGVWAWFRRDFKRISAAIPKDARSRLVGIAGNLCGDQSRAEIEWFYKPMIGEISGAPRIYANALEKVDRCVAWRKAKGGELSAALSQTN
jgi:cytosol alanyl aminopeptidase